MKYILIVSMIAVAGVAQAAEVCRVRDYNSNDSHNLISVSCTDSAFESKFKSPQTTLRLIKMMAEKGYDLKSESAYGEVGDFLLLTFVKP